MKVSSFPKKMMTSLEFDQEIHEAIQQEIKKALECLNRNEKSQALSHRKIACYLDSYSELLFNDSPIFNPFRPILLESYQTLILEPADSTAILMPNKETQEAAHTIEGYQRLWNFEDNVQENKKLLQKIIRDLPQDQTLQSFIEQRSKPKLYNNLSKAILQLPLNIS